MPRLLRGSLVTQRRRCGKANCRCADGVSLHESPALSYSHHGRTRTLVLPADQVAAVAAAIERYRAAVTELDRAAETGITSLSDRLAARRRSPVTGWIALPGTFRAVFTAPSFAIFTGLLAGWVCAPGRRTVTAMIAVADPARPARA